jgi:outer membrane protein
VRYRYLIALIVCSGCVSNRGAVDPYAYAPKTREATWKPLRKNTEPPAVPKSDEPLTLAEVIDIALKNNPQTKLTWAQARVAAAQWGISQAADFPTLNSSYTYQRSKSISSLSSSQSTGTQVAVVGAGGGSASGTSGTGSQKFFFSQWGPQLQLSYTILDFGQTRASTEVARQALFQADYLHNYELQTVIQQVTTDYYNYLYQQELMVAREADLETARVTYEAAQLGLDMGVRDMSDLLQARTQLLQAQIQMTGQRQSVVNALASLLTDMGLNATTKIAIEKIPAIPPTEEMLQNADQLLAVALDKRADLLAAEAALKSQEANVALASRKFLPTLAYSLNFGETSYSKVGSDHYDFTSTFTLSFPIFSGFSTINTLREARAQKEAAKAQLRQVELNVIEQITTSHSNVKTTFESLKYSDELLKVAQKEYDVALARYKAGTGTILELVSAQSSLADARAQDVLATNQWFTSLVELSYAAGTLEPPEPKEVQ